MPIKNLALRLHKNILATFVSQKSDFQHIMNALGIQRTVYDEIREKKRADFTWQRFLLFPEEATFPPAFMHG